MEKKLQGLNHILVKERGSLINLSVNDILWIQSDGNYITLHTEGKKYVVKQSLKSILDLLGDVRFIKIQKSYVVRADLISLIDTQKDKVLINGTFLPIGRSFKENLIDWYTAILR